MKIVKTDLGIDDSYVLNADSSELAIINNALQALSIDRDWSPQLRLKALGMSLEIEAMRK